MTRRRSVTAFVVPIAALLVAGSVALGQAQLRGVKADLKPTVDTTDVRAGASVRVTLKVTLPAGVHVQSHKPRDPSLVPTALTLEPPPGVRVEKIVYPTASDLAQEGQKEPLAVYGPTFSITVHLALARDLASGDLVIPARLQYQACDDVMCYRPARADTRWTLRIA